MSTIRRFATRTVRGFPLVYEDESGERVTEKVNVVYRSHSSALLNEIAAAEVTEGKDTVPFSAYLAHQVVRIYVPGKDGAEDEDLTGDYGKPVVFYNGKSGDDTLAQARAFFDNLSIEDVAKTMYEAIENDINPPKPSLEGGQGG